MKKLIALFLLSFLILAGCGSGISQEDLAAEWEAGYEQGKEDGRQVGYKEGRQEGYDEGYDEGYLDACIEYDIEEFWAETEDHIVVPEPEPEPEPEVSTESSGSDEVIVYVTDTGTKYHQSWCSSLWNSSHEKTLPQAIAAGYAPCKNCDPPS